MLIVLSFHLSIPTFRAKVSILNVACHKILAKWWGKSQPVNIDQHVRKTKHEHVWNMTDASSYISENCFWLSSVWHFYGSWKCKVTTLEEHLAIMPNSFMGMELFQSDIACVVLFDYVYLHSELLHGAVKFITYGRFPCSYAKVTWLE